MVSEWYDTFVPSGVTYVINPLSMGIMGGRAEVR